MQNTFQYSISITPFCFLFLSSFFFFLFFISFSFHLSSHFIMSIICAKWWHSSSSRIRKIPANFTSRIDYQRYLINPPFTSEKLTFFPSTTSPERRRRWIRPPATHFSRGLDPQSPSPRPILCQVYCVMRRRSSFTSAPPIREDLFRHLGCGKPTWDQRPDDGGC